MTDREQAQREQRTFAAPLDRAASGHLIFARGASLVTLEAAPLDDLFRATFDGPVPQIDVRHGKVSIQFRRLSLVEWARYALLWGQSAATFMLNRAIPWRIAARGGVSKLHANLSDLSLSEFSVHGGASEVALSLPHPSGVVPLRIVGGASNLAFRYPAGVAVGFQVRGGASKVAFEGNYMGSVGGGLRLATQNYPQASDRYDVEVVGGANKVMFEPFD